ncbi:MAG: RNA polymerase factor sigma-54 [Pseudomonadota bacterium]
MKQTLALKLGQQLKMTPQLQQAIRLLQLSALDLQQEIQSTLESNPLLEMQDEYSDDFETQNTNQNEASPEPEQPITQSAENSGESLADPADADYQAADTSEQAVNDQLEQPLTDDLPVDSSWEDNYPTTSTLPAADSDFDPLANRSEESSLTDHLIWQLNLTPMASSDRVVALAIIDALDPAGLLTTTTEDLWQSLLEAASDGTELSGDDALSHDDVCAVLSRIQDFDPIGVAARDLRECLLLQLDALSADTPWLEEARLLLAEHLDLLGSKDFTTLRRKTKLSDDILSQAMRLIRTLNPRPGSAVADEAADFIVPDVVVRKAEGRWLVELNSDATPQIRINPVYEGMVKSTVKAEDKAYLRDNLTEAKWFLKSLQTRNDTLLRVAAKIVEVQRGFLEYGPEAMKPLILADIAEAVDLHESTISRVTSHKYMSTPRGVFELKYFFSSHVGTETGGEVSSTAIRALIQKLTSEENAKKPLSDSKIAAILKEQNINVARRTVAKYRESLSIPPSNERKQLV